ncbi:universal stress protein [Actinacidiphila rubida]|uniref:Nucleotide-binding universal stress protein, UspA family n=1 Tax=Actinacidiphila rubida TaxID=310780 RepID=A0A1H8NHM1_9ACTN|nr:universal stress protein [Actinacidiphila rubida]SEO28873.1 Nucleotide-binding universal stress protein, UspA family [Actinacidiphila rubida]
MARPIVVGVDGSAECRAAARWAAEEALRGGFPVHLVHAWGWHPQLPAPLDIGARSRAERTVRDARAALQSGYPEVMVASEMPMAPADAVLLAGSEKAEMLVLGSCGHSAIAGFLLGSIGLQILARAGCPVVMVRADARSENGQAEGDVIVGLQDLDHPSQPLLRFAFTPADRRKAAVRAVHTWNLRSDVRYDPQTVRLVDADGTIAAREEKALADAVRPWEQRFPHLRVLQETARGAAGGKLAAAAAGAAMVVVGRKVHRPVLGMRIGPVTHDVLHHVTAPVVVVPHD